MIKYSYIVYWLLSISVHELSQFDLYMYCSETLPDAPEVAGNLAGLYCNLVCIHVRNVFNVYVVGKTPKVGWFKLIMMIG